MDKSSSVNKPEPTTALFAKRFVMSSVQVRKAVSLNKHWTTLGSENLSEKKSVIFNDKRISILYKQCFFMLHITCIDN